MWTDLYLNFQEQTFGHCCKQIHYPVNALTIEKLGKDVFWRNDKHYADRKTMVIDNQLPQSCKFCIDSEPNSIRHVWNSWNDRYIENKKDQLVDSKITSYIELDIGRSCDLACVYCGPWSSSTWAKELGINHTIIDEEYAKIWRETALEALRQYLFSLPKNLNLSFNILGGEPLLITYTYDMIEFLAQVCEEVGFDNKPTIMITTNLNCKPKLLKRLLETINNTSNSFNWNLSISMEDIGERAERVRYHLDWNRFETNLKEIKKTNIFIYLTVTINILSFPFLNEYFDWAFMTLGQEHYGVRWDFTMNSVQDSAQDISYCTSDLVDVEKIVNAYIKNIKDLDLDQLSKEADIIRHLNNMRMKLGTKIPDSKFFLFWEIQKKKRNIDYTIFYPLNKIYEIYKDTK
jgi:organic radical activating enzyme